MFLEDYFGFTSVVPAQIQARVLERVRAEPGMTIAAVLAAEPGVRANDVYVMLAQEQLYDEVSISIFRAICSSTELAPPGFSRGFIGTNQANPASD